MIAGNRKELLPFYAIYIQSKLKLQQKKLTVLSKTLKVC